MDEVCSDNRFEIIKAAKDALCDETNIEESPTEWAVIDSILFRMWQMGWLPGQERTCKVDDIRSTYEGFSNFYVILSCGHRYLTMLSRPFPHCPECGAKVVGD